MRILIRNDSPNKTVDEAKLEARAKRTLGALECDNGELSVWICDDEQIGLIHGQYFNDPSPTNVISFAQNEGEWGEIDPEMLGDVVISFETAARDAAEADSNTDDEVCFLLIHGILHLMGYDHEGDRACDAPEMEKMEEKLFKLVTDNMEHSA